MSKIIYIAVPSKGVWTFDSVSDTWEVSGQLLDAMALFHVDHPDWVFISPSMQNYQVLPFLPEGYGADYEAWKTRCRALLPKCDVIWVLQFPDWERSVGVADEVQFAKELGLQVVYINMETLARHHLPNDGWLVYDHTKNPPSFEEGVVVEIETRDGRTHRGGQPWLFCGWNHNGFGSDIIRYREL